MSELQMSLSVIHSVNFGDHGERLRTDHEVVPGETVEDLVQRAFPALGNKYMQHDPTDVIELRVVVDKAGFVTGMPDERPPF